MQGLGWLLFSFRGEIKRSDFLLAIIVAPIAVYIINFLLTISYSNLLQPVLFKTFIKADELLLQNPPEGTNQTTHSYNKAGKNHVQLNIKYTRETPFNQLSPAVKKVILISMIPLILSVIISNWVSLAIYIKRYRDIGLYGVISFVLVSAPIILSWYYIYSLSTNSSILERFTFNPKTKLEAILTTWSPIFIMLIIYLFIPLLWPSRYRKHYR